MSCVVYKYSVMYLVLFLDRYIWQCFMNVYHGLCTIKPENQGTYEKLNATNGTETISQKPPEML